MTKNHSESYRAGGIIIDPEGFVCLVPHEGKMVLPSAHRKQIEDAFVVAKEMLPRMTGLLEIVRLDKVGTYTRLGRDKGHRINVTFFVFSTQSRESLYDLDWVPLADLPNHAQNETEKEFLQTNLRDLEKTFKKSRKTEK